MKFAIIAAGKGSRLVDEGVDTPKPLVPLNGETMIERLIRIFLTNRAESISIIVNKEMQTVYEYLQKLKFHIPLHIIQKSTPSSMHSFYELSHTLGNSKFCLTTIDTIFREEEFSNYIKAFRNSSMDGLFAVTDYIDDEKPLYVETDDRMNICDFKDNFYPGTCYISGGIYGLDFNSIPVLESSLKNGVSKMRNFQRQIIKDGLKLQAWPFSKIIDVDHQEDIYKAELFLKTAK